jgi:hypothetical protein
VHNSSHGWKGLLIDVLAYAALLLPTLEIDVSRLRGITT